MLVLLNMSVFVWYKRYIAQIDVSTYFYIVPTIDIHFIELKEKF